MFCPNCGANNSTEQKFCRSCGLNLQQTALSLLEQIPSAENASLLKREQRLEKFGNFALGGFGVVLATAIASIIYVIITRMILTGESIFTGILLAAFIAFAGLTLAYVFLNEHYKEKKQKANSDFAAAVELSDSQIDTNKLLAEKRFDPVPTRVTEGTTDLLYTETKTRKLE